MDITDLKSLFSKHYKIPAFASQFEDGKKHYIDLNGLKGSSASLYAGICSELFKSFSLCILPDKEEAAYFYNDLCNIRGEESSLFFPSTFTRGIDFDNTNPSQVVLRTELLKNVNSGNNNKVIVTYPEAIIEKVITKQKLDENTLLIKVGNQLSLEFIIDVLNHYDFSRTDFVYGPGQFSVRGSIIDIFSFSDEFPYRIDFFGNEVESIRTFDVENQLSKQILDSVSIIPDISNKQFHSHLTSLLDFIPEETIIWARDLRYTISKIESLYTTGLAKYESNSEKRKMLLESVLEPEDFELRINEFSVIEFEKPFFSPELTQKFDINHQPAFNKNYELLCETLFEKQLEGYKNYLLSDNIKQIERLKDIFSNINPEITFTHLPVVLHEGFIDNSLNISCFTDHQIFDRYHKYRLRSDNLRKEAITLSELSGLHPGDYIVHVDHGIGIFGGLEKVEVNGKYQEAIRLVYKDHDVLLVSIHNLHKISKYKGKDGEPPKIYKLGTGAWQKLKLTTKKKVKDIARDLIALYAKRKQQKGFEFSPDTYLQEELEASFIYEDTPDQVKATKAVKENMQSTIPMDMLVCGDVGFGKTEVAIRAAFKAVADSKQVAVLVPTTILALQHYKTFRERLSNFPCSINYISRFKSAAKQKEILKDLADGKLDILIGTHRIIGKDVKFKDIGLLIIDEEQKFGVAVKEKLKQMKVNIDTLTLSATPIPRTLQFSLMGARDLSIINTPPPNRYPIVTEVHTFDSEIIAEAINYEVNRGGQVFFIHNRIQNIFDVDTMVRNLCPRVKTVVAHGQLEGDKLENIMVDYINGDYDVLISTTIIENGVDIPNTNTIIVNNAQNFGLSDLHQLRGRVGRSNKKAFCYLLIPSYDSLTGDARRRLKAIEEFAELGSGFNIALQDLDIRGAGNLLGSEQSGFIADIGFETYQKILNEAMLELKEGEFRELYADEIKHEEEKVFSSDCQIDTDLELLFPEEYIDSQSERIKLYRELDSITDENSLCKFRNNIIDRFGKMPDETGQLLNVVRLRWIAQKAGFEKILLKNHTLTGYFISDPDSMYFKSVIFGNILRFLQSNPGAARMRENNHKLSITIEKVFDLGEAIKELERIIS